MSTDGPSLDGEAPQRSFNERFPALLSRDFRLIFVNGFFTAGSRWTEVLARGWLVHELSGGSTGDVGWVTFASFAPFVVVGPFAGAFADRVERRSVLIAGTVFGLLGALVLAFITITDVVQVWHVIALAFATGAAQAIMVPTRNALIANVVPPDHLLNAVALGGIARHGSRVIGPLFAAGLLRKLGPGAVFVFSAVLLAGGLVQAIRISYRSPREASPTESSSAIAALRTLTADLAKAAGYVRRDKRLLLVMGLVAAHCSFTMAFDSMMPTMAETVGGGSTLYSAILVGLGSGAICGTLTVSQLRSERSRGTMFAFVGVGSGVAMVILGSATTAAFVVVAAVLAGFTQAAYMTMSATLVQAIVTDEFRGRVMSVYLMIAAGHMAILNLGYGRTAETIDVRILLIGPGLLWIAIFVTGYAALAGVRSLVRRGRFDDMNPALEAAAA